MFTIIQQVITGGRYELSDLLKKIDTLWVQGDLNDTEKQELTEQAQENAKAENSMEITEKLKELDLRVTALEQRETTQTPEEYPEYVIGKWYYSGDKITCDGDKYVCIAPEGQVCTWSPFEYPAYWEKVTEA